MEFEEFSYSNNHNQLCVIENKNSVLSGEETIYEENKSDNYLDEQNEDEEKQSHSSYRNSSSSQKLAISEKKFKIKKQKLMNPTLEESQDNFILFGEIFCYFKSFLKYCKIGEQNAPEYCYLSDFRPVLSTQIENNMIYAHLDCSDGGQQIKDIKNNQLVVSNFNKIDYITKKLRSISDQNAFIFTNHLQNYKNLISQYADMLNKVHTTYNFDYQLIQEKLNENFIISMGKANSILSKIQKENPNTVLQFFIKKLDAHTLTSKTNITGGNNNFIELISGTSNQNIISYYFTKFGTPEVLDWKGIVEITMAQFTGNQSFQFDLQTIDGYSIPAKAQYNFILLNSIEIIPGFSISDVLETYVYEINPMILKCIKTKRSLTVQKAAREDISYTIKSEIFIQKFYPEQMKANKQRLTEEVEKQQQKNVVDLSSIHTFCSNLDPFIQQQEIQSELFRINRQVNAQYY